MKKSTKKFTTMALAFGLLLVGGTGAIAHAAGSPYETYKDAAMKTAQLKNMTVDVTMQVKQDGADLANGTMTIQKDGQNEYSKANVDLAGEKINQETSKKDGKTISFDGKNYTAWKSDSERHSKESLSPNTQKLCSMLADTLVGDVKNQFTSSSGKTISVHLDSAQVPELANVAFSAAVEMQGKAKQSQEKDELGLDVQNLLTIKKDAKVKSVDVIATEDNGRLTKQNVMITLTGKDKNGKDTEVNLALHYELSKIRATTVKTIDTTGKTVKQITREHHE